MPITKKIDWLDKYGTNDRGDKVSLNHTAEALVDMAQFLIDTAMGNMDKSGSIASGGIRDSMKIVNVKTNAVKMSLDIEIDKDYKWTNFGVKGVESGSGKYSFKTKYPNKKMAKAIRGWLRNRKIVSKYKAITKTERKNKKIKKIVDSADGRLTGLSYAISTNIKKHGIKKTGFFTKAVDKTKKEQKKRYADAFKLDIIESLNNN